MVVGNALQAREAGCAARRAALNSGMPRENSTIAANRRCSSRLAAITMAAQPARTGEADIAVEGGTENMSQAPFTLSLAARFDGLPEVSAAP